MSRSDPPDHSLRIPGNPHDPFFIVGICPYLLRVTVHGLGGGTAHDDPKAQAGSHRRLLVPLGCGSEADRRLNDQIISGQRSGVDGGLVARGGLPGGRRGPPRM